MLDKLAPSEFDCKFDLCTGNQPSKLLPSFLTSALVGYM